MIQSVQDINNIVRWAVDSDLKKFGEDAYGVTGTAFEIASNGDYLRDKFRQMQTNFIMWLGGLSGKNRERLARNITLKECEKCDGKGYAYHDDNIDCDECNGTGNETEGE